MPDNGFISTDPLYYAQQFQQGRANLQDTQAQAAERLMKNQQTQAEINSDAAIAKMLSPAPSPDVTVGPWQDSTDPSISGATSPAAAAQSLQSTGQSMPGDSFRSQADTYSKMAAIKFQMGAGASGRELLKAASDMNEKASIANRDAAQADNFRADTALKGTELVAQYADPAIVTDQASYDNMLQNVSQIKGISPTVVSTLPKVYSPDVVKALQNHALTTKDKIMLNQSQLTNSLKRDELANTQANQAQNHALEQARLEEEKRFHDLSGKNGGLATAPTKDEVGEIRDQIINRVYGGNSPDTTNPDTGTKIISDPSLDAGASAIANRVQAKLAKDKTLDRQTAISQAIQDSIDAKDWPANSGVKNDKGYAFPSFKPKGKLPDEALPAPPDISKAVKGTWYLSKVPGKPPAKYIGNNKLQLPDGTILTIPSK